MIGSTLSVIIDLMMVMLLVVTISYCFIVNSKLTALRTDQSGIRQVIGELNRSSERAEKAIGEMRRTALHVEGQIAGQMEAARHTSEDLRINLEKSKELRDIAKKFSEVDIHALKSMENHLHPAPVTSDQMEISKQLKRQKLGFGHESFAPSTLAEPQSQHTRTEDRSEQAMAQVVQHTQQEVGQQQMVTQNEHRFVDQNRKSLGHE
ncbi:hypothetical protein NBRC116602_11530 [Hyphomicrobiales bacterium 4NK60-0047b]|jgi:hypothetical protein